MHKNRTESVCQTLFHKVCNKINYFGDNSCLHGVGKVFSLSYIPFFKRVFWLSMLVLCSWGAAIILRGSLALYSAGVVSYSVETDYLDWDTPFPAVTVCEPTDMNRLNAFLVAENISVGAKNFYKEISYWQSKFCSTCTSCKYNETCLLGDIEELVKRYRLNCTSMLKDCSWDNKPFECCDKFHPIETEYGTCYVFNSRLIDNETTFYQVNRQIGLPQLAVSFTQVVVLRVHSPDDVVTVMSENILGYNSVQFIADFEVLLNAEQTISDPSIQPLSPAVRGCLLGWEKPPGVEHWPFKRYTYNQCVWHCRAMAQYRACNCTHHFVPRMYNIPRCGIKGLGCLHLSKEVGNTNCVCPMDCDDVAYKTIHVFNMDIGLAVSSSIPYDLAHYVLPPARRKLKTKEMLERGSRAVVRLAHLPYVRVLRHAIRDDVTFVVDVGGVGGVFFGASVLSVLEIVYLFCIRRNR